MSAYFPSVVLTPEPVDFQSFEVAAAAVDRLIEIYERNTAFLRSHFAELARGEPLPRSARVRAWYPAIRIQVDTYDLVDTRLSYGHVSEPGVYEATITQPRLFQAYQIGRAHV